MRGHHLLRHELLDLGYRLVTPSLLNMLAVDVAGDGDDLRLHLTVLMEVAQLHRSLVPVHYWHR